MVRRQVYITPQQQHKTLKRLARQAGKTESEVIRDALEQQARVSAWREIEAGMDQRASLRVTDTGRTWKRVDLYDREGTFGFSKTPTYSSTFMTSRRLRNSYGRD